jgi:hypothetical protein
MTNTAKFVTSYSFMSYNIYLVVDQGKAYILNYDERTDEWSNVCPCCLANENRKAIMDAVRQAIADGTASAPAIWCDVIQERVGSSDYGHWGFDQTMFVQGCTSEISPETKALVREEALRQWAAGNVSHLR